MELEYSLIAQIIFSERILFLRSINLVANVYKKYPTWKQSSMEKKAIGKQTEKWETERVGNGERKRKSRKDYKEDNVYLSKLQMIENLFRKCLWEWKGSLAQFLFTKQTAGFASWNPSMESPGLPRTRLRSNQLSTHICGMEMNFPQANRKLCPILWTPPRMGSQKSSFNEQGVSWHPSASAHPRGPDTPPGNQISQYTPKLRDFLWVPKGFPYPFYIWFSAKQAKLWNSHMRLEREQLGRQAEACVFPASCPSGSSVLHHWTGWPHSPANILFLWPAASTLLSLLDTCNFTEREKVQRPNTWLSLWIEIAFT